MKEAPVVTAAKILSSSILAAAYQICWHMTSIYGKEPSWDRECTRDDLETFRKEVDEAFPQ